MFRVCISDKPVQLFTTNIVPERDESVATEPPGVPAEGVLGHVLQEARETRF